MQRYFVRNNQFNENIVEITGDDFHHMTRVMRMTVGGQFYCCNEEGHTAICVINEITEDKIYANITNWLMESTELPISVTIASGLPKGDKLEWIVQKGTELGAASFFPFQAARSIVKWDSNKGKKKVDRLMKIAKEAAEQSHRNIIPSVSEPLSFLEFIKGCEGFQYKLVAYEEDAKFGESTQLAQTLKQLKSGENIVIAFGPEGGFTDQEIELLRENGFITCGLGPRILRTETAPLYVLAAVSYHFELLK